MSLAVPVRAHSGAVDAGRLLHLAAREGRINFTDSFIQDSVASPNLEDVVLRGRQFNESRSSIDTPICGRFPPAAPARHEDHQSSISGAGSPRTIPLFVRRV